MDIDEYPFDTRCYNILTNVLGNSIVRTHYPCTVNDARGVPVFSGKSCVALYNGFTNQLMCFGCYPVLLGMPGSKSTLNGTKVIPGSVSPVEVMSAIHVAFRLCYPDAEPEEIIKWNLYKYNRAYYGTATCRNFIPEPVKVLRARNLCTFGGSNGQNTINWQNEQKILRYGKLSKTIAEYLADTDLRWEMGINDEEIDSGKCYTCDPNLPTENRLLKGKKKETDEKIRDATSNMMTDR